MSFSIRFLINPPFKREAIQLRKQGRPENDQFNAIGYDTSIQFQQLAKLTQIFFTLLISSKIRVAIIIESRRIVYIDSMCRRSMSCVVVSR